MTIALLKPKTAHEDEVDPVAADDFPPRIKAGVYEAQCFHFGKATCFGREQKIFLHWGILIGQHKGLKLEQWFKFYQEPKRGSKYHRNWFLVNNGRRPLRKSRMSPSIFKHSICRVMVRDTKRKYPDGRPYPDCLQYSVVDEIVELLAGGGQE